MMETKASRLEKLSHVVAVPRFFLVKRGDLMPALDATKIYIVRSVVVHEDQQESSWAGQYPSFGPLTARAVGEKVGTAFQHAAVAEVIIQEYAQGVVSGVAFLFARDQILVEYAAVREGVTAGKVNPFVALLPTDIPRYKTFTDAAQKIFDSYGPCDVEFVDLEHPRFVQMRPLTRSVSYDQALARLKMLVQEHEGGAWTNNDICRIAAEHGAKSFSYAMAYCESARRVFVKILRRQITVPTKAFLKIGAQIFMAQSLHDDLALTMHDRIRLALRLPWILQELRRTQEETLDVLFDRSMVLSFLYALTKRQDFFAARETLRTRIDAKLAAHPWESDIFFAKLLAERIAYNQKQRTWHTIALCDKDGINVVLGDMTHYPLFHLTRPTQNIPSGAVVCTPQLYPELGRSLTHIKGIICTAGALTSHVAILAREHNIPLVIQKPCSHKV